MGIPKPWLFAFMAVAGVIVALVGATVTALVLRDDGEEGGEHAAFNEGMEALSAQRWDDAEAAFQRHLQAHP
ncbi:MAG: hypothetical protein GWN71_33810, partial [Gammaproteobacteria bacterium]|nr:hypothetical protein [Gemmatimonadota bacterium]NIU78356.1 hypothetical protein [Gammaproteobacteria bacterium]